MTNQFMSFKMHVPSTIHAILSFNVIYAQTTNQPSI